MSVPYHAWTHRPKALGGTDPIEFPDSGVPKLYDAPGQIVRTHPNDGDYPNSVEFPGGVIVAHSTNLLSDGAPVNVSPSKFWQYAASRDGNYFEQSGATWDDADDCLTFRPVEDLGCIPGMVYGMWISWHIVTYTQGDGSSEAMSGTPHIEAISDHTDDANRGSLGTGGYRFPNATDGPTEVIESASMDTYTCWGMAPFGGYGNMGDFPQQSNDWNDGVSFRAGETITIRAWMENPDASPRVELMGIDEIIFMPRVPFTLDEDIAGNFPNESANFVSNALEVIGYRETPEPTSYEEVEDGAGQIYGPGALLVEDTQELLWAFDPDGHFTIAQHDESSITGLYTAQQGGSMYVYVLCRGVSDNMALGTYVGASALSLTGGGHVTTFVGSQPISDGYCDDGNSWAWIYAGEAPIGPDISTNIGVMCWLDDGIRFSAGGDSVRISSIAYIPKMAENLPDLRTDLAS